MGKTHLSVRCKMILEKEKVASNTTETLHVAPQEAQAVNVHKPLTKESYVTQTMKLACSC